MPATHAQPGWIRLLPALSALYSRLLPDAVLDVMPCAIVSCEASTPRDAPAEGRTHPRRMEADRVDLAFRDRREPRRHFHSEDVSEQHVACGKIEMSRH